MKSAPKKIAIIDYGLGNLFSVKQALLSCGADAFLTQNPAEVLKADALVLPGVGAFHQAMKNLKNKELDKAIIEAIQQKKKFMGVCLGLQLLFESSEEFGHSAGLGVLSGTVRKLEGPPHIAWSKIHPSPKGWEHSPLKHLENGAYMYFVHSYYVLPTNVDVILSQTEFEGFTYCSSVQHQNLFAVQFHPEKSAAPGIDIYKNWLQTV